MASSSLSEDLTCSVCLNIFTDPVILSCGHSFCRECITLSLKSLNQCPQCRTTVPTDRMDFTTNHILKSLSEKAKQDKESGKYSENEEIGKTKEKSQQLRTKIRGQFQEMHQFLKRREDEIMNELNQKETDELKEMREGLEVIEKALSEGREFGENRKSILEITEPEILMKSWSESNSMETQKSSFNPKGLNLQVVNSSLSLGPYESHLQFFVWKEMLQVIQPKAEKLSFKREDPPVWSQRNCSYTQPGYYGGNYYACQCHHDYTNLLSLYQKYCNPGQNNYDLEIDQIEPGPNYWEIDVKEKNSWTVKIQNHSLTFKNDQYTTININRNEQLNLENRPETIAIYFNSITNQLQFFDADSMKHLHTSLTY